MTAEATCKDMVSSYQKPDTKQDKQVARALITMLGGTAMTMLTERTSLDQAFKRRAAVILVYVSQSRAFKGHPGIIKRRLDWPEPPSL